MKREIIPTDELAQVIDQLPRPPQRPDNDLSLRMLERKLWMNRVCKGGRASGRIRRELGIEP